MDCYCDQVELGAGLLHEAARWDNSTPAKEPSPTQQIKALQQQLPSTCSSNIESKTWTNFSITRLLTASCFFGDGFLFITATTGMTGTITLFFGLYASLQALLA